ncbi:SusD family protein [Pedobacter sp. ok626]|uniref:RagB/SusD family nutrient uptake outer membrane protein n=1 Tax=Pedobacter sp. ok626 TaxID=1761882 RepID=UPI000887B189|nr:RagB/SusD family nutrient uptake outer membrane protein [Pedobacter sp. ok626]SDK26228.1 SusD family protein [Pedobacter sp. ok626]
MKKKIFLLFMLPILGFIGCEKKLEIVPAFVAVEEVALRTMDGVDAAVGYSYFFTMANMIHHTHWSVLMSDEIYYKPDNYPNYLNFYKRDLRAVAEETMTPTDLRGVNNIKLREMYNSINTATLTLRAVQNDIAKNDRDFAANKDRVMGECYFVRAVCHFQLVKLFAKAWGATPDNSHPGIIINEEPVSDRESQIKRRATVAQVYAFIIDDLIKAGQLLPERFIPGVHSPNYNGRAYRDAARGVLARVYFQQQNYVKAREVIDRTIGSTPGSLSRHALHPDVTGVWVMSGEEQDLTNSEVIWMDTKPNAGNGHSHWWNSQGYSLFKAFTIATAGTIVNAQGVNSVASTSFEKLAKFSNKAPYIDQRKVQLFRTLSSGELMPAKYGFLAQVSLPLIRSAELVLSRAEIYAMDNNIDAAVKDCNVTRLRAGISPLLPTINQADLLDSIRTERLRELAFEGDRLWNLKRLKLDIPPGNRPSVAPLPWDGLETVLKYFLPEQDKNPLLENNY